MKKILTCCFIALAFACNSGETDTDGDDVTNNASDSLQSRDEGAINNDVPMRTTDTAQNLMMDTTQPRDTMNR